MSLASLYKSGRVLASQGVRYVHQVSSSSRLQITTLVCASAAGSTIPPMHIFAGERFSYNPLANGVEGVYFGKSINGWMTQELFNGWITNHFVRHISPEHPVCLIVDGHSSHIDLDTSKFCEANGILLYCLPPHSSHITQPLDVGLFSPLKKSWQHAVAEFQYETGECISKQTFARVFRIAYMKSVKPGTIINAFRASGIYLPNRSVIDDKKLKPSQPYQGMSKNDTSSKQHSGERMALKALENAMDDSILTTYKKRSEEGYDIDSDPLYNTWSKLTKAVCDTPTVTTTDSALDRIQPLGDITNTIVSDLLKLPEPKQTKRVTRGTTMLPKHLSSQEMIQLLEEKRENKLKEEEGKRQRKAERESRRKNKKKKRKKSVTNKRQKQQV